MNALLLLRLRATNGGVENMKAEDFGWRVQNYYYYDCYENAGDIFV